MAESDPWKRYLEAGMELTQVTRDRAEKLVKDLVKAGEVQRHEAQERVEALLDRSRRTTEAIAEAVRVEVMQQMQNLGLVQPPTKPAKKAAKKATAAKKAAKKPTGQS
jgi:polyhydroxyalkanoate synthesis regulator phasin